MDTISKSLEDYLETIMLLEKKQSLVRVTDIAASMDVAKSSVHIALHALSDRGLVVAEKYKLVTLTEKGRRLSDEIYSRHLILKEFFEKFLKVSPEIAEHDACAAEHVLSKESMDGIIKLIHSGKVS